MYIVRRRLRLYHSAQIPTWEATALNRSLAVFDPRQEVAWSWTRDFVRANCLACFERFFLVFVFYFQHLFDCGFTVSGEIKLFFNGGLSEYTPKSTCISPAYIPRNMQSQTSQHWIALPSYSARPLRQESHRYRYSFMFPSLIRN